MDQYSPTYSNDRAAKDQTALLIALIALLAAALVVVFLLGPQGGVVNANNQVTATPVADMQKQVTALSGTFAGLLAAPVDGPLTLVNGPASTSFPAVSGHVSTLLQTDMGLWIATTGTGDSGAEVVLIRNAVGATPFVQRFALPANAQGAEIRALAAGLGRLWIGTSKGLLSFDWGKFNPFTPPSRFRVPGMASNIDVTALYLDNVGVLWIGTRDGLLSYNGTEAFRHTTKEGIPDNKITALSGDQTGQLYCGTEGGLACYEHGNWVRQAEITERVNTVLASEDNVWVGTPSGIFQRLEGRWSDLGAETKMPKAAVTALAWAPDGAYAATETGVYKLAVPSVVATAEKSDAPKTEGAHEAGPVHGPEAPPHAH